VESDDNGVSTKSFPKVFVHCEAGINRSGTIVAAAMMYFAGMNLLDAAQQLKRQRGIIMTNATFQEQLVEFAERLASERE
jgi:protein-tyrosine phosphatase